MASPGDLGISLVECILHKNPRLLIKEDAVFLEHFISKLSKQEYKSSISISTGNALSLVGGVVVAVLGVNYAHYSVGFVECALIAGASIGLFVVGRWLLIDTHTEHFRRQFVQACDYLQSRQLLSKGFLEIVQEADILFRKNEQFGQRAETMRETLGSHCKKIFRALREASLKLHEEAPVLNFELQTEISSLCGVPLETFDELLKDELCVPTISQLNSLILLIKLQMSEFLRKLMCIFLVPQNLSVTEFVSLIRVASKSLSTILKVLRPDYEALRVKKDFEDARWQANEAPRDHVLRDANTSEVLFHLKNARVALKGTLLELDATLKDASTEELDKSTLAVRAAETINDLEKITGSLKEFHKFLTRGDRVHVSDNLEELPNVIAARVDLPNFDDDVEPTKDYEIYEADELPFVDIAHNSFRDDSEDYEYKKKIGISIALNQELKDALLVKSNEHRAREAKALGVSIDQVPQQSLSGDATQRKVKEIAPDTEASGYKENLSRSQMLAAESVQSTQCSFSNQLLGGILARGAAEKSKKFNVFQAEDNFGDSSDSDSEGS